MMFQLFTICHLEGLWLYKEACVEAEVKGLLLAVHFIHLMCWVDLYFLLFVWLKLSGNNAYNFC